MEILRKERENNTITLLIPKNKFAYKYIQKIDWQMFIILLLATSRKTDYYD